MRSTGERGAAGWLAPSELREMSARIRAALAENPRPTTAEISKRTGASVNFVNQVRTFVKRRSQR